MEIALKPARTRTINGKAERFILRRCSRSCSRIYRQCDLKEAVLQQTEKKFFEGFMRCLRLTLQMRNSKTGTAEDYLISPVRNASGTFFDSRRANAAQPRDADANGAYNIARKGLWTVNSIKIDGDKLSVKLSMTNTQWLEYAQKNVLEMG